MTIIEIKTAHGRDNGYLLAKGHAGNKDVCTAITAIVECLAVNLDLCWDVRLMRRNNSGDYELRWRRTKRARCGIERANQAAGFAYNGLKALAKAYPQALSVTWIRDQSGGKQNDNR